MAKKSKTPKAAHKEKKHPRRPSGKGKESKVKKLIKLILACKKKRKR